MGSKIKVDYGCLDTGWVGLAGEGSLTAQDVAFGCFDRDVQRDGKFVEAQRVHGLCY